MIFAAACRLLPAVATFHRSTRPSPSTAPSGQRSVEKVDCSGQGWAPIPVRRPSVTTDTTAHPSTTTGTARRESTGRLSASTCTTTDASTTMVMASHTAAGIGIRQSGTSMMPARTAPAWTVQDGIIVGNGDKGRGYLIYAPNKNVADLELKFSYRFPGKGNSGVSIRAIHDKTRKRDFQSYHADIGHLGIGKNVMGAWDFHTPGRREHRCFRGDRLVIGKDDKPTITPIEGALTAADIKKGDWNHVHIIAKGNNFKLFINTKLSSEFTEHLPEVKRLKKGMIQFQLHDPGMIVHFKDLYLKVLK